MKTAEEKRKVAENLHEQAAYSGSSSMYMEAFIEDLRQIIDPYNMSNSYADLYGILADLIEPSEAEQWVASQGLTKEQLEFDWWLSGRVMHELGFDGDTAGRDEVESRLLARLMPEGMEWPRFEDREPVRIGDEFAERIYGNPCKVGHFAINKYAFLIFDEEDVNDCEAIDHGTHERPDSWERLEEDARQLDIDLNDTTDEYPRMSCCRDLVRRARALAEGSE